MKENRIEHQDVTTPIIIGLRYQGQQPVYIVAMALLPPAYVVRREGTVFTGVCLLTFRGGVPGLRFSGRLIQPWMEGGSQVSDFWVGSSSLRQGEGGGGVPVSVKGKNFWHQIWLDTCSDWKKNFLSRDFPPSKGKIFWHQIWLDSCSDWKKYFFVEGPPPP